MSPPDREQIPQAAYVLSLRAILNKLENKNKVKRQNCSKTGYVYSEILHIELPREINNLSINV